MLKGHLPRVIYVNSDLRPGLIQFNLRILVYLVIYDYG